MPNIHFPWPINIKARGIINGTRFNVNGAGVIRTFGVYEAILNFDKIPPHFHPSAIGTFIVSDCCGAGASMRNGGLNMSTMGVEEYDIHRKLDVAGGEINLRGKAFYTPEALVLDIDIDGDANLPDDLISHSIYIKRVYHDGPGIILGVGNGSLFRQDGSEVPVDINTRYLVQPNPLPNPMKDCEYRIATEDGLLFGLSYHLRIHSIFDGGNTMSMLESRNWLV